MNATAEFASNLVDLAPPGEPPMTDAEAAAEFEEFERGLPERFLAEAAREGNLKAVRDLVEGSAGTAGVAGVAPVPPHARGAEALRWACFHGYAAIAVYLLTLPLPPEDHAAAARELEYEAVRTAIEGGHAAIVAALIPFLTLADLAAARAAELAARHGRGEVMKILCVRYTELSRAGAADAAVVADSFRRAQAYACDPSAAETSAGALIVLMYYIRPTWRQLWAYLVHDAFGTGSDEHLRAVLRRWGDLADAESALATADLRSLPVPPGSSPAAYAAREFVRLSADAPGMAFVSWRCLVARLGA